MNIQNNQISFSGLGSVKRDSDWICRKVKTSFPMISPTRLYYDNPDFFKKEKKFSSFLKEKSQILQADRADRRFLKSPFKFIKEVISSINRNRIGNCAEHALFAEMISRINGVKNCYRLTVRDRDLPEKLNHTFLLISKDPIKNNRLDLKNSIIVDPWVGISGRAKEVLERYKNQFGKLLNLQDTSKLKFGIKSQLCLDENEINLLKSKYPELVFKSRDGHELLKGK